MPRATQFSEVSKLARRRAGSGVACAYESWESDCDGVGDGHDAVLTFIAEMIMLIGWPSLSSTTVSKYLSLLLGWARSASCCPSLAFEAFYPKVKDRSGNRYNG